MNAAYNHSPQHQVTWGQHSYTHSFSIQIYSKPSSLHPPRKFLFPLNLSLPTSSHPSQGRPAFCLVLDGRPKRIILSNLASFICRTCPSHFNLSLIVALETWIELHLLYSLLFKIRLVSHVLKTTRRQFL